MMLPMRTLVVTYFDCSYVESQPSNSVYNTWLDRILKASDYNQIKGEHIG